MCICRVREARNSLLPRWTTLVPIVDTTREGSWMTAPSVASMRLDLSFVDVCELLIVAPDLLVTPSSERVADMIWRALSGAAHERTRRPVISFEPIVIESVNRAHLDFSWCRDGTRTRRRSKTARLWIHAWSRPPMACTEFQLVIPTLRREVALGRSETKRRDRARVQLGAMTAALERALTAPRAACGVSWAAGLLTEGPAD